MRAHTITTAKARTIVAGGILALSLAVALLAATATTAGAERGPTAALTGTGVTTPTASAPPLTLALNAPKLRTKKFTFFASTSNDSTLVSRGGGVKKITKQLAAGEWTKIKAKLKAFLVRRLHQKRSPEYPCWQNKGLRLKATDEFGQTATDTLSVARVPC